MCPARFGRSGRNAPAFFRRAGRRTAAEDPDPEKKWTQPRIPGRGGAKRDQYRHRNRVRGNPGAVPSAQPALSAPGSVSERGIFRQQRFNGSGADFPCAERCFRASAGLAAGVFRRLSAQDRPGRLYRISHQSAFQRVLPFAPPAGIQQSRGGKEPCRPEPDHCRRREVRARSLFLLLPRAAAGQPPGVPASAGDPRQPHGGLG